MRLTKRAAPWQQGRSPHARHKQRAAGAWDVTRTAVEQWQRADWTAALGTLARLQAVYSDTESFSTLTPREYTPVELETAPAGEARSPFARFQVLVQNAARAYSACHFTTAAALLAEAQGELKLAATLREGGSRP